MGLGFSGEEEAPAEGHRPGTSGNSPAPRLPDAALRRREMGMRASTAAAAQPLQQRQPGTLSKLLAMPPRELAATCREALGQQGASEPVDSSNNRSKVRVNLLPLTCWPPERLARSLCTAVGANGALEGQELDDWLTSSGRAALRRRDHSSLYSWREDDALVSGHGNATSSDAVDPEGPDVGLAEFARSLLQELSDRGWDGEEMAAGEGNGHGGVADDLLARLPQNGAGDVAAEDDPAASANDEEEQPKCKNRNFSRCLHNVKLEKTQLLRLPSGAPLRLMIGDLEIFDKWLEANEELSCEVRVFCPRSTMLLTLFPDSSHTDAHTTSVVRGEPPVDQSRGCPVWLFGEELAFESEEVSQERRADGVLHAQIILISHPSGERLASTSLFKVPTENEKMEPLWSRSVFSRKVGRVSVAGGWIGPDLLGWLSGEVLRRAAFGRWSWVVETLAALDPIELRKIADGSVDDAGRNLLLYAAMSAAWEPLAAEVLERLLDSQANTRTADAEGLTAIHYAAFGGSTRALSMLLKAGNPPDVRSAGGVTPLMLAAFSGGVHCVRQLLNAGASPIARDDEGLTAACWVCLGCGEPPSRSGRNQLLNQGPEEARATAKISRGLHEALDRRRFNNGGSTCKIWGGPDRRELLGQLVEQLLRAAPPNRGTAENATRLWLPVMREAARNGPVRFGCFTELVHRLHRLQGLRIPVLATVLLASMEEGGHSGEQLCRMMLRECAELPVTGSLPDGRSLVEAALDHGWDEVALLLCDRGAVLDSDLMWQARALRAAVESGHQELARRLVSQWSDTRDNWSRPAAPDVDGLAECPVCFCPLWESPGALFTESGRRACPHLLCLNCAAELSKQSGAPRCPICRQPFQPPARRPPDPREDPAAWFAFFDEGSSGFLEKQLLQRVLPAVVPVDTGRLTAALNGPLWAEWDPAGEGRISRSSFCAERGLLRWLAEHLGELQEEKQRGEPPDLSRDREGWFRHWAKPGAMEMGKAEVLRAVLKSTGASSLDCTAIAASREWIERCWLLWDRDKNGRISLSDFCTEGGLADMMLQQSSLASGKRIVRRMELEPHDPAALVACCQQLVECAVGIRPEDAVERWPTLAVQKLRERAALPVGSEYEAILRQGAQQIVGAMQRLPSSAKLFAWSCRAMIALSYAPAKTSSSSTTPPLEDALDELLNISPKSQRQGEAPIDFARPGQEGPLWQLVMRSFLALLPSPGGRASESSENTPGPSPIAPGAIREAGLCALAAIRVLADRANACDDVVAELAEGLGRNGAHVTAAALAWRAAAVTIMAVDLRSFASSLMRSIGFQEFQPGEGGFPGQPPARLETGLIGILNSLDKGLQARPPRTPGLSSLLVQRLLAGLHSLPTASRAGAGIGPDADEGQLHRGRVTVRGGHIAVGDVVRLRSDVETARREQEPPEHFGGWCDRMAFCLDCPGRVVEIPRRAARLPEVLRISHGALGCWCWNVNIVAEVIKDAGLLPFEEGEHGPGAALTIGDEVRIAVVVDEAKRLQVNHGGWNERMTHCCGRIGRLEAIDKAGDMKVLVPGVGAFVWNPAALRAPHAQRWESALCERLAGPLEGTLPLAILAALLALGSRVEDVDLRAGLSFLLTEARGSTTDCWTCLAAAALSISPPAAVAILQEAACKDITMVLKDMARPRALLTLQALLPGRVLGGAGEDATLDALGGPLQLLQAWWESLPISERRSRGV